MTPSEIITADCKRNNIEAKKILDYIAFVIHAKKGFVLHNLNSVLFVKKLSTHDAELHLFTSDHPFAIVKAVKHFAKQLKNKKITQVYGKSTEQKVIQLVKTSGVNVKNSDIPEFGWMAKL